jgi:hypothetical protein
MEILIASGGALAQDEAVTMTTDPRPDPGIPAPGSAQRGERGRSLAPLASALVAALLVLALVALPAGLWQSWTRDVTWETPFIRLGLGIAVACGAALVVLGLVGLTRRPSPWWLSRGVAFGAGGLATSLALAGVAAGTTGQCPFIQYFRLR